MGNIVENLENAIKEQRAATLTMGVCEIVANNESKHAARIVLCTLTGALMKKGETELAEKIVDFVGQI